MKAPDNTMSRDAYLELLARQEKERKKPSHEESNVQQTCVKWFRQTWPEHALMMFAVPNGGKRKPKDAAIMKGEGVTAGVSDLIFLEARGGYGALCIEMKRESKDSRQRDSQKAWQEAAERAGNLYVVCRGVTEFQHVFIQYMKMPPTGRVTITGAELNAVRRSMLKARNSPSKQKTAK